MIEIITNSEKLFKTFVFEKQQTQQSVIIDTQIDLRQPFVNLSYLFASHCPLQYHKVSIYDPISNQFVTLRKMGGEHGFINRIYLEPSIILIRYKKKQQMRSEQESLQSDFELDSKDKKDPRSKERTIAEVIQLVKKWRKLHMSGTKSATSNKRMNLQEAARVVGISKKSLDDYYCQLRLAELHNFNFSQNMNQKMGVLRSFVKQTRTQPSLKLTRHHKHPKVLKIIDEFDIQTKELGEQNSDEAEEQLPQCLKGLNKLMSFNDMCDQKNEQSEIISEDRNPFDKELFTLENQFYKGFQFLLDEPSDPFLQINNKDFTKKSHYEENDSIMFF